MPNLNAVPVAKPKKLSDLMAQGSTGSGSNHSDDLGSLMAQGASGKKSGNSKDSLCRLMEQ